MRQKMLFLFVLVLSLTLLNQIIAQEKPDTTYLSELRDKAESIAAGSQMKLVKSFLAAAKTLQPIESRTIYYNRADRKALTENQFRKLGEADQGNFASLSVEDKLYYGYYSTPLAWIRPIEILARNGVDSVDSKRILDFGFGNVAQLRMLASLGADVTGIEIAGGIHQAMYSHESDQGAVPKHSSEGIEHNGNLKLAFGQWPSSSEMVTEVGRNYDLIVSKNVLKLGYIHPQKEVPKQMTIDLGVTDERFLNELFESLNPGGIVLVYNIHPSQSPDGQNYKPWAHGETPWKKIDVEKAGFDVVAWHVDDSSAIQSLGIKLGWRDSVKTREEFETGFRAMYTILKKTK